MSIDPVVFIIEKDRPISGRRTRYPFGAMEVGDSFFVPETAAKLVRSAATKFGQRRDRQFLTRRVDGGLRVWRIS